jgi:ribosomal protein L23
VAKDANKIQVKQAVEKLFKVKVEEVRTATFRRQTAAPRTFRRLSVGLEESIRETRSRAESARVHGDVGAQNGD